MCQDHECACYDGEAYEKIERLTAEVAILKEQLAAREVKRQECVGRYVCLLHAFHKYKQHLTECNARNGCICDCGMSQATDEYSKEFLCEYEARLLDEVCEMIIDRGLRYKDGSHCIRMLQEEAATRRTK